MELKDIITIICDAKKEADFDPKFFSFYDPKDDLEETVANFCNSNQSVLFVPGMFIAKYNDRFVSIALIVVKLSLEKILTKSVIDLDQFVKMYGQEIPLDVPLEKEYDGKKDVLGKKKDPFILLANNIAEKCRYGNFGVDVQILNSKIKIHPCEKGDVNLVVVGFRIDHV